MNEKTRRIHRNEAAVLRLSDFRGTENHSSHTITDAVTSRAEAVRKHVEQTLLNPASPAVAAAIVHIDSRGHIGISATGIEPEMAVAIADELRLLADTIEQHRHREKRRRPIRRRELGYTSLAVIAGVAFVAATYVNPFGWLDAILSLAAQITATLLSATRITKRSLDQPERRVPSRRLGHK